MGCDLRCGHVGRGDGEVVWTGRLSELEFMGLVGWAVICVADMLGAGMGRLFGLGAGMGRLFGLGGCLNWNLWD